MAEPSNKCARFASTDEESMKALLTDRVPENTKRSTDQWLRTVYELFTGEKDFDRSRNLDEGGAK